jgi:hypothetical protein
MPLFYPPGTTGGGSGAPTNADYVTLSANASLSNETLFADLFPADIFANIPAAGTEGRYFHATDIFKVYRDNGVSWDLVAVGLDGSSLLNLAWLGTGTPDNTKFLRGDATWAVPAGGSGVTEAFVIAMATAL